ncbi:DNA cytosine methyltransferase [Streptomyces shenzhenensis]
MPYIDATTQAWAASSPARAYKHDGSVLTAMSWFCGAGGDTQGGDAVPGVQVTRAANHWDVALATHAWNNPDCDVWKGDIRRAPVEKWPVTDLFWASPECFPAGTLILARRGLVPIEEIREGDEVFTHARRWRQVVFTMHRPANTVRVRGGGLAGGIETTSEHPFYTRRRVRVWDNTKRRYVKRLTPESEWTEAKDLEGRDWATPIDFGEHLEAPRVGGRRMEFTSDFWWMVGRWLGDGSVRLKAKEGDGLPKQPRRTSQPAGSPCIVCGAPARPHGKSTTGRVSPYCSDACKATNKRQDPNRCRYELTIVGGFHEADELAERLAALQGLRWQRRELRTASAFTTAHRGLVEWLVEHFGQHAHGKTVPAWALTLPVEDRRALLDGYVSADGKQSHETAVTTVSKRLALGIRLLANSLGEIAHMSGPYTRRPGRTIEGRTVNERPSWHVTWVTGGPRHVFHLNDEGHRWMPVKDVEPTGREVEVYNITVADDESYVADGITVHNCPKWSAARGVKRDFDRTMQGDFDFEEEEFKSEKERRAAEERSRALMEEVPMYLRGVISRGGLVLAGVVENVIDCRDWDQWDRWVGEFHKLGYRTKLLAINSMHVAPRTMLRVPQSRDRLYFVYWHESIGRNPDFDKWVLRPDAWCSDCDQEVRAVQVFRKPGKDMGRYRQSYDYRCPNAHCRAIVEPSVLPAAAAIDFSILGTPIGDREKTDDCPEGLAPATIARVRAGGVQYWGWGLDEEDGQDSLFGDMDVEPGTEPGALLVPAGGTWRNNAISVDVPMPTRTTVETDGVAFPPFLVPCEGRTGKKPMRVDEPMRTQTARAELAIAHAPFVVPMRGGGDKEKARHLGHPLHTVSAGGNHHGLVSRPDHLLVPYYGNGQARPVSEPVGALPTRDRYALVKRNFTIDEVLFRMLQPHEIHRAMAFRPKYKIMGSKRHQVRQLGNAVTPAVAEVLYCALVECITGEEISRYDLAA